MKSDLYVVVVVDSMVRTNVRAYGPLGHAEAQDLAVELNSTVGSMGPGTAVAVPVLPATALVRDTD